MINPGEIEVILVEDNPRDAEMTLRALRKRNLANTILHLKDGQEVLDLLLGVDGAPPETPGVRPKVILLDIKLPKVDGLEVLRALRADERTRTLTIVMLTSSREQQDIIESHKLGVNSYIVKPVDFDNFSEAISQAGHYWLLLNQPHR